MNGRSIGNTVIFYVVFPPCYSVTAWRGQLLTLNVLPANWQLAFPDTSGQIQIQRGADNFRRTN